MRENAAYVKPLQPLHIREDYREDGGKARFDVHPALYHVDFRTADESPYAVSTPVEHDAHFRRQPNAATKNETPVDVKKRAYVGDHSLAARSFATATPISNMMLFSFVGIGETMELDFRRAITVSDVLSAIQQEYVLPPSKEHCPGVSADVDLCVYRLDKELSVRDAHSHLLHAPHANCVKWAGWGLEEAFENLQTAREVLTLW